VQLRVLSGADVEACMGMAEAVDAMAEAFAQLSGGAADVPVRAHLATDAGVSLFMPAWLPESRALGAKVVSVFRGNADRGLPAIHGVVLAVDPETGVPSALLDGTRLTALRTGAASGLATRLLAREDARVLAAFGAGVQARTQIEAVRAVRPIAEVRVVSRGGGSARALAGELDQGAAGLRARAVDDPAEALEGADVVVAATTSSTPVFPGAAVGPGTHVNGVGSYTPDMREVDADLVRRARVVVDAREAALEEAGDLIAPHRAGDIDIGALDELGEIVLGRARGRADPDEVTFFKSVGSAAQDMVVAARVLDRAREERRGTVVEL